MPEYPYEATFVEKDEVKPVASFNRTKYAFLVELKEQLQPNQAVKLVVPANKRPAVTDFWRRLGRGEAHSLCKKQEDGSYIVYLWLGSLN